MEFKLTKIKKRIKTKFKPSHHVVKMYSNEHRLSMLFSFLIVLVINSPFIYCNEEAENLTNEDTGKFLIAIFRINLKKNQLDI